MTQYAFGSGTLIGKRTDVANTPPALLGTLESVSLDFDRKIELLLGQYNMPVAAGGGEFKIAGKAKFARLQATQINNLFLGQTLTANSMLEMTTGESDTVASGAVTVTNSATFAEDFGVFYSATGAQLTPVASAPTQGQYSVSSGVYLHLAPQVSQIVEAGAPILAAIEQVEPAMLPLLENLAKEVFPDLDQATAKTVIAKG